MRIFTNSSFCKASKLDAKFNVEKLWKCMRKCSQKDPKTMSKINDESMKFQNLRFLVFCEEYNVKIVFLHDQGYQESIKNQLKVNANSMLEKGMQKTGKVFQNGAKRGANINKKSIKNL